MKRLFKQGIYLSGWGDLNSRPSVPQCDSSRVRPVVGRHKSCDSGPVSPTGTDYDCLHGSQGRTSVILVVILSTLKPPQKHPTKKPHQKAHRRNRVIYTESDDTYVAATRHTQHENSRHLPTCSTWVRFRHLEHRVG